ncbi:exosortase-associated protein EpsI, V-type [Phenylobacterium sp.]|uniref:exosortase-associated protein EpsI, V-type n=1 Tax=Phenylobacterium sp. TaxID=1871053 RepID=UPI0011FDA515|nr:exosortase-associated protein EpsI, V-type [Phenylobacterium sp.]TAL29123.1 MAG: EpsI family protein [Phenylobacterium sp.]
MNRRYLIFGALGVGALGAAEALRPRHKLRLLQSGVTIDKSLPESFGTWSSERSADYIGPELDGSLTRALYSEIVPRTYFDDETGDGVMLLAAYGDTQSDLLQLHRPESCYPAVGFNVRLSEPATVALGGGVMLPARKVIAYTKERTENIIYWTRLGEALPQSAGEQRQTRIDQSIEGIVPDGILVRLSALGDDSNESFKMLEKFVPQFLRSIPMARRKAFIGTKLSNALG